MPVPPPETANDLPETCRELAFEGVPTSSARLRSTNYDLVLKRADRSWQTVRRPWRNLPRRSRSSSP